MDSLARDVRFAFRLIRKAPVFVLSSAIAPIVAGLGAGVVLLVPGLIALTRVFRFAPVPLHAFDPGPYLMVVAGLVAVSLGTMMIPARRASAVSPSDALRTE